MSLSSVFNIAGSGMSAQTTRLNTVASNIANAETVSSSIDQTYRARHPVFATMFQGGQSGGSKTSGLDGLLGNVKNTNDLNTAFSALGMDSGMVGQFAPVILQYLGGQGANSSVLGKLAQAWGTGS